MKNSFSPKLLEIIDFLTLKAVACGVKIYFVGGLVRDVLMGKKINDIDILIEGNAIDFVGQLGEDVRICSTFEEFATAKTIINGLEIDFASTRKEIYPQSGCLPVVVEIGCPIEEDLIRRDFTINAIAYDLCEGKIIDKFFGKRDLGEKKLKILHKNSFIDDPTRILRGLDFELRFGFKFNDETKKIADDYLKSPSREGLSVDRVYLTLKKLFCDNNRAKKAFFEFVERKYYKILFDENIFDLDLIEHALEIFAPNSLCEVFLNLISQKKYEKNELKTRLAIYKTFKNYTNEELCSYFISTKDENALLFYQELKDVKVHLKGANLLELGFSQGPKIGQILDALLEYKLQNPCQELLLADEANWVVKNYTLV